ncbi:hypothetical protein SAMN04488057_103104 [Cyclobacterium lianum]|uniref:CHRD domain-containing protein n=1 Tax=Cyclobacterium lianum TaxID=388280 RepID=A0A1M7L4R3_9BACT|nr:hypothetical protein [Cyclobacterium lianum]SHM72884.1 hypothetical protein SAMN04488057_103104 [Cyclobacterium lianum]
MKYTLICALLLCGITSCEQDPIRPDDNRISYDLYQSSDFNFDGKATFQELENGDIELLVELFGAPSADPYFYTGHLHFGSFDQAEAPIAHLLNPIDSRTLSSRTIIGRLSDGSDLNVEDLIDFDGHIKIHLADQGPDYNIILASGNIGKNDNSREAFNSSKLSLCVPHFPDSSY